MAYQSVFQRYEIKYLLTREQKARMTAAMAPYMALDRYGRTTIRNVYFDTPNYRLIRRSMEKPVYKEKLRIRSYQQARPGSEVFVELKKKYKGVVYKRRLSLPEQAAVDWMAGSPPPGADSQIRREIDYFLKYYGALRPTVFLSYEREAYYCREGGDFRVTFDDNIRWRTTELSLCSPPGGERLLPDDIIMMEVKAATGLPLWLTEALTREKIYKTPFSKYGTAYETVIYPTLKGGVFYV